LAKLSYFGLEPCVFGAQGIQVTFFSEDTMKLFTGRYKREAVEVMCPICKHSQIVYFPEEEMPECPKCKKKMIVKEVLTEGKY
jgi:ribosomal protein S27E